MSQIDLYYREFGHGEPFVMLHGNGESSQNFQIKDRILAKHFKLIAPDTRGHGNTPCGEDPFTLKQFAQDLYSFLHDNHLNKVHLLGFSDGANIAMLFAMDHPELLKSLILNSGNLTPSGMKPNVLKAIKREYEKLESMVQTKEVKHQTALLNLMLQEPQIDPSELHHINIPTLVIAGNNDMISRQHTEMIAKSLPNSKLVFIEGDHFIAYNKQDAFDQQVLLFEEELKKQ